MLSDGQSILMNNLPMQKRVQVTPSMGADEIHSML